MRYQDIVPDYNEYVKLQTEDYQSFEGDVARWKDPQVEAIRKHFADTPRGLKILDCACGDGTGLRTFKEMGFTMVTGIELCSAKAEHAHQDISYPIYNLDAHDLGTFKTRSFDIVYSSHTLEHCYDPQKVLSEFHRILKPNGTVLLILPYPDNGVDRAHGGKYELRTDQEDDFIGITQVLKDQGLSVTAIERGQRDGPEIIIQAKVLS